MYYVFKLVDRINTYLEMMICFISSLITYLSQRYNHKKKVSFSDIVLSYIRFEHVCEKIIYYLFSLIIQNKVKINKIYFLLFKHNGIFYITCDGYYLSKVINYFNFKLIYQMVFMDYIQFNSFF